MTASDLSLAKQALARQDLDLLARRERKLQRFIARQDISTVARQAGLDQLDDLRFERDTVEMALETHTRMAQPDPASMPRTTTGCECGEFGGSEKTCDVHGYGNPTAMAKMEARS
jgi:hypothetical protein